MPWQGFRAACGEFSERITALLRERTFGVAVIDDLEQELEALRRQSAQLAVIGVPDDVAPGAWLATCAGHLDRYADAVYQETAGI